MSKLILGCLFFNLLCVSAQNLSSNIYPEDILKISNPNLFGKHILAQLQKNEARFLSNTCFNQMLEYGKGLLSFKMWAIQLFDASEKLPSGLLRGYGGGLGTFDQCLNIKEHTEVGTIKGKYCIGGLQLADLTKSKSFGIQKSRPFEPKLLNLWDNNVMLPWGICLPDGCAADDFRVITLFLFNYQERFCQTAESQITHYDAADYATIALLTTIACLIIISTLYDITSKSSKVKQAWTSTIFRAFSILSNTRKITTIKRDTDEITCLYGLRAFSLLFITGGLRFVAYPLSPLNNWFDILEFVKNGYNTILLDGLVCMDTFFVISGMLVTYNFLSAKDRGNGFNIILYYLNRIIRLTPALAIVVLVHATLLRHYGSGPLWPYTRELFVVESCRKYWWSALLYIQNYYNPGLTTICLPQSWHVAVDMQLFILSPLILWPLSKVPKLTVGLICFLLLCTISSAFIATWIYEIRAILVENLSPVQLQNYLQNLLYPLHTRAASWIIGLLLGYILFETKKVSCRQNIKKIFSPVVVTILWIIAAGFAVLCLMVSQTFFGTEYNWLYNALHNSLVRPIWAIAICWVIFACAHGYGGPVNKVLSSSSLQVISRISYCTYLVNFSIIIILTSQTRTGLNFNMSDGISRIWGDIAWSLAIGYLTTIALESPMIIIQKTIFNIFQRSRGDEKNSSPGIESGKNE